MKGRDENSSETREVSEEVLEKETKKRNRNIEIERYSKREKRETKKIERVRTKAIIRLES